MSSARQRTRSSVVCRSLLAASVSCNFPAIAPALSAKALPPVCLGDTSIYAPLQDARRGPWAVGGFQLHECLLITHSFEVHVFCPRCHAVLNCYQL